MSSPPLIAIVGRPNVGKSTLFNRIIRRRQAVVDEVSGVTRDRIYAHAEWAGIPFRLVDTGGLVPNSKDPMEVAIRAQADVAIAEADLVLFIADVETGVTDLDSQVALKLLRSGQPVVLVVNKVDNAEREAGIYEFHSLGLGNPWPLSAMSGRGSGDMLDAILDTLSGISTDRVPELPGGISGDEEKESPLKIAVLGRPNVGKSSYVNAVCGTERVIVSPKAGTTRDSSDIEIEVKGETLILIDTAGLRRKSKIVENIEYYSALRALQSLDRCDVALLLIDAAENVLHQDARILVRILNRGKGAVLVVNKWDLIEKETGTAEEYEKEIRDRLPFARFVPVVYISSLSGQRVEKALNLASAAGATRRTRIQTAKFNSFMESMIQNKDAITPAMGDVRISYVVQADVTPPGFVFFVNDPKKVKPNFKRYLERRIRQEFNLTGTPIRLSFRSKT